MLEKEIDLPWALNHFSERVKNLRSDTNGFEEVDLPRWVNYLFAGIMPVKVHDWLLQPEQIVDSANNNVDL